MSSIKRGFLLVAFGVAHLTIVQQPLAAQKAAQQNGASSTGGYEPPPLSLVRLLENDTAMNQALMTFARTGDSGAYRAVVFKAAQEGNLAAELLLGMQYLPEQCGPKEPNQDMPHCGKNGDGSSHVIFRENPLGIEASYEEAARWLEKASAQGSGEASEVLAQLITRMQANGHHTPYTAADSTRLHALARSQDFDVERLLVTCYKLVPGSGGITLRGLPNSADGGPPEEAFTPEELRILNKAGISGSLIYGGGAGFGESAPIAEPEGPAVRVRIILDHNPGSKVLLPTPSHHDEMYVQRGDKFLSFPSGGKVLPRSIHLEPQTQDTPQVSVFTQTMDGGELGGSCTVFP
jgi:hypothetical protein